MALGLKERDSCRVIRATKAEFGYLAQAPEMNDNRALLAVVMQAAPETLEPGRKLRLPEAELQSADCQREAIASQYGEALSLRDLRRLCTGG